MPPTKFLSLGTLKYEEVVFILEGLGHLSGVVDDLDTLTQIDELQKKIKFVIEQSKTPFRS